MKTLSRKHSASSYLIGTLLVALGLICFSATLAMAANASPADSPYPAIPDGGPKINVILATSGTEETVNGRAIILAEKMLEKWSGGKIQVDGYNNSQLGNEREAMEGVQTGNITMTLVSTSVVVPFIPEMGIFDMPRAFKSREIAYRVCNEGAFAAKLRELHEAQGFKALAFYPNAYRQMTCRKPVRKLEDFNKMRIRTMENEYQMAFFSAQGCTPVPISLTELYTALQQGLVDGCENPFNSVYQMKWYEQQKYMLEYDQIMFVSEFIMNKGFYDGLPDEYRSFLDAVMKDVAIECGKVGKELDDESKKLLIDAGVEIIEISEEIKDAIGKRAGVLYEMIRKNIGDEVPDIMQAAIAGLER